MIASPSMSSRLPCSTTNTAAAPGSSGQRGSYSRKVRQRTRHQPIARTVNSAAQVPSESKRRLSREFASRRSGVRPRDLLLVWMTSAGDEREGPAQPSSARPPGPKLLINTGRKPASCPWRSWFLRHCCSPLEILGNDHPRDCCVHGDPYARCEPPQSTTSATCCLA